MEAEKKANEIIELFIGTTPKPFSEVKNYALIHVNGIIEALERASMSIPVFWQEVKTIIENK